MQTSDARLLRKNLPLALQRYSATIGLMEQTVLLPSLLRDVPSGAGPESGRDLYGTFMMLKAVRSTVDSGLVPLDDLTSKSSVLNHTLDSLLDSDPELVFLFHLRGLLRVMSALTQESQLVTHRYMDIVGVSQ